MGCGRLSVIVLSFVLAFSATAKIKSGFKSTVAAIDIPNTHIIYDGEGTVIRGSSPENLIEQLSAFGITDVLIFKNPTKNEVKEEISELKEAGFSAKRIHHIPFRWKETGSFEEVCGQVVEALEILDQVSETKGRKVFFHCTVGEDRTGMLAGLFRILKENWSVKKAFTEELCENGYEAGNPDKPFKNVVKVIREELTPVYLKMAYLIETGAVASGKLDASVCASDPADDEDFSSNKKYSSKKYVCQPSSKAEEN